MDAVLVLVVALPIILLGAEFFTNAIEHVGMAFGVSEGVTGSLLAAVGTALPETAIPVLASWRHGGGAHVAVGAVLGAPLMLSTLTMAVMGLACASGRGLRSELAPEQSGARRDLGTFVAVFLLAFAGLFLPPGGSRLVLAAILVAAYGFYVRATVKASAGLVAGGHRTSTRARLHLARSRLRHLAGLRYIQLLLGLGVILAGAQLFISGIESLGALLKVSVLTLALVIVPIATELPEKVNSVLWIRRRQDTLALGNVTGAMVFQGSLLPALGLTLTPWRPAPLLVAVMLTTLAAAVFVRMRLGAKRGLRVYHMLALGLLYVAVLGYLLTS